MNFAYPQAVSKVPASPDWLHEIKFDGYRRRVKRNGDRVRLRTRGGYDWTKRFPPIVEAALKTISAGGSGNSPGTNPMPNNAGNNSSGAGNANVPDAPGTNSAGTAISSGTNGRGRIDGTVTPGPSMPGDMAIKDENQKVDSKIKSICKGC